MPNPVRRLLVLTMLCLVAPVSAEGLTAPAMAAPHWSDCPYERARAAANASVSSEDQIADSALFSRQARDFLP